LKGDWKVAVIVDLEKCTGCGTCEEGCPVEAIKVENEKAVVDQEACVDCGTCVEECPEKAISEGA
jgi:ferredoxin